MASILKPAYAFYNRQYLARPILTICTTNALLAGISDTLTQKYLAPPPLTPELFPTGVLQDAKETVKEDAKELAVDIEQTLHEPEPEPEPQTVAPSPSQPAPLDLPRMGRFMLYNFSVAPVIHTWYSFLDKNFPLKSVSASALSSTVRPRWLQTMAPAIKRMVADQTLFAPIGLALLFSGLTVLEGGGIPQIQDKLNNASFFSTYLSTLKANYAVWPLVQLVNFGVMPLQLRLPFVSVVGIAWNAYLSMVNTRASRLELQSSSFDSPRQSEPAKM
ncbi:hypothetical protein KVV02_001724 [Mortierella alpina]|uniref:Uncharacterized protein n=1 Tax=Mortierella alpina TaxID=64518 RepID=A0A9P8CWE0_MORAP|nr:hypothetical protein KVV02_001724 [Mortierella alpina]